MSKIALISVYDKEGIVEFAQELIDNDWTIISSGGSAKHLEKHGINVTKVEDVTQYPELLSGRVKTLHPKIHAGLLARSNNEKDMQDLKEHEISKIDLLVCNLYPFAKTLARSSDTAEIIENIDIGGPAMIRAAAKNYENVFVIVDKDDYQIPNDSMRQSLAAKAFAKTASYDVMIADYFASEKFPNSLSLTYQKKMDLRYGENPHQKAAYYEQEVLNDFKQLHGKELSFNNINDMTKALQSLSEFERPSVVAIKHANACGIASGDTIEEAFRKARAVDPESIFGGIIALNRELNLETAKEMSSMFLELIVFPSISEEAFALLSKKKNLRLIKFPNILDFKMNAYEIKDVINGVLVQERDQVLLNDEIEVVSERKASQEELDKLMFAWKAVKHLDSNAIVIAKEEMTIGLGHGEVKRFWSCEKAIARSEFALDGAVLASDGFFFEDTVEYCNQHNIKAMIQPGGSIHDQKVIDLANQYDMLLVFTKTRHFKH
ncbi:MAG: bifunctional phosphoribosylaminoimidazolecarboxamide formyltransferase/IMP cyclohydrolase [Erysipelothrix sp.]|nr:bifunctional phosphoribosylaminoimidazolecarboxamide formyltransferase/IMP cyclohydrolase [Erysipelothrix sp.]